MDLRGERCNHPRVWTEWAGRSGEPCSGWHAHPPLADNVGLDWQCRTKAAAAYPALLCRALAWAIIKGGGRRAPVPMG